VPLTDHRHPCYCVRLAEMGTSSPIRIAQDQRRSEPASALKRSPRYLGNPPAMGYSAFVACFLMVPLMPFQPSAGNLAPTASGVGANFFSRRRPHGYTERTDAIALSEELNCLALVGTFGS
jgi:hypothetical protein